MSPNERPIGIFDSGIGGLTVYQELKKFLPNERFVYLGDTARVPYGTKSRETVIRYAMQNSLFLMDQGVKLIVVACNTASAFALSYLQERVKTIAVGVIEPGADVAAQSTKSKRVGIIGTEGTIRSGVYEQAIKKRIPEAQIFSRATGLFVPIVEEGIFDQPILTAVLDHYLTFFNDKKIDTLILGCTHYPVLRQSIQNYLGPDVTLVDSATATAITVKKILQQYNIGSTEPSVTPNAIYVTDAPERVERVARSFLLSNTVPIVQTSL